MAKIKKRITVHCLLNVIRDNYHQVVNVTAHRTLLTDIILLVFLVQNKFFYSTLSEFENFLLCERILINVTTCQNETSS
jgi:hypothetical protein